MMRMTMSSPNVMRRNRPDWLSAFNFFLFPLLSDLGGYPTGFDRTNFKFIVPFESKRSEWKRLWGINLWDEQIYRITMRLRKEMDTVVPDSFQIALRQYLEHPEVKSLGPDGTPCAPNTAGLLRRVSVLTGDIVPIGKETDRHWEQGGDPSMLDFSIKELRKKKKMGVADVSDRKRWRDQGVRYCQRKSRLSPSNCIQNSQRRRSKNWYADDPYACDGSLNELIKTVNALLGNWNVLTSSSIRFVNYRAKARALLSKAELNGTFDKNFWKQLSFFALVKPKDDILPVRTVYDNKGNKRTQNIGLNYLSSKTPIWYAGPDLIASKILTGKAPRILKAIQLIPGNPQKSLKATNLGGMVEIKPLEKDFYCKVIEQRILHKKTNKALADFLKVLANAGSYGLFVEVNAERKKKEESVSYFSGEKKGNVDSNYVEKPGPWFFPPVASLITAGGRLLLAMLEKSVQERGGGYLFCDTDSLCIVGSRKGGFVECPGGPVNKNNKPGLNALSLSEVQEIAQNFRRLNPYDPSLVPEILKIEDVNFYGSSPKNPFRQLFGYAISAKRYALYSRVENHIHIEKASGHGLGYLFAPKERKKKEEDEETPQWVLEAWQFLLRRALKLTSKDANWLDLPTMMRMVVTTPNVFRQRRPEWLGPFNFFLFPMLSETFGGYPKGFDKSNFIFITPYESDRRKWSSLLGVNLIDGESYQIAMQPTVNQDKVIPDSFRILLRKYLGKSETKSLAPDGTPCTGATRGLLQRARITAGKLVPVGKETDRRWEQGEDPSMIDSDIYVFEKRTKLVIADPSERKKWAGIGLRRLMRESKLTQAPVSNALKGKPVRPQTLSIIRQTADRLVAGS